MTSCQTRRLLRSVIRVKRQPKEQLRSKRGNLNKKKRGASEASDEGLEPLENIQTEGEVQTAEEQARRDGNRRQENAAKAQRVACAIHVLTQLRGDLDIPQPLNGRLPAGQSNTKQESRLGQSQSGTAGSNSAIWGWTAKNRTLCSVRGA
jgi:hypothetical protein